jgi:hypothetical protein
MVIANLQAPKAGHRPSTRAVVDRRPRHRWSAGGRANQHSSIVIATAAGRDPSGRRHPIRRYRVRLRASGDGRRLHRPEERTSPLGRLTERRSSNSRAGPPPVTARSGRSRSCGRRINRSSSIRAATFASPHIRWGRAACCRAGRYVGGAGRPAAAPAATCAPCACTPRRRSCRAASAVKRRHGQHTQTDYTICLDGAGMVS